MPFARSDMTTTTVDNGIYIFGGCVRNQTYNVEFSMYMCGNGVDGAAVTTSALYFDPLENVYHALPDMPRRRFRHAACAFGRNIYIMGGTDISDNIIQIVDVFNVDTFTYTSTLVLANATSDPGALCIDNDGVYFFAGYDRPNYISHAEMYRFDPANPTNGFQPAPKLYQNRGDVGYATLAGTGYAFGGWTSDDGFTNPLGSIEIFFEGQWHREIEPAYFARADFAVGTYLDRIFFFGGENKAGGISVPINEVERYWPVDGGIWTQGGEQLTKRFRHMGASWSTSIFLFGGQRYLVGLPNAPNSYYPLSNECDEYFEALSQDLPQNVLVQMHGAGTKSNEDWMTHVLSLIQVRLSSPVRTTYRHLTSATANIEFINAANDYQALLDYYASDLPLSAAEYQEITQTGGHQVFHFPLALNKVAVLVNVPDIGNVTLNMTACVLAQVFTGAISTWNDATLANSFPALRGVNQPIVVTRQPDDSMLTWALANYLTSACPSVWKLGTSATISPWSVSTLVTPLTMTDYLLAHPYAIGYDSVLVPGLAEVALTNLDGETLISTQADATVSTVSVTLPPAGSDYSSVVLLNAKGHLAWPMVTCNYLLVRGDWTGSGQTGALFQAFVAMLMSPEGRSFATSTMLPPSWAAMQQNVLNAMTFAFDVVPYMFEGLTPNITTGSAWNTISSLRGTDDVQTTLNLQSGLAGAQQTIVELQTQLQQLQSQQSTNDASFGIAVAGLVIALVALIIAIAALFALGRGTTSNADDGHHPPLKTTVPLHHQNGGPGDAVEFV